MFRIFAVLACISLAGCETVPVVASGGIPLMINPTARAGYMPNYMPGTVLDPEFMRSVRAGGS